MSMNVITVSPVAIGAAVFVIGGVLWMIFFWRVVDPFLRRMVGRLLGATIRRGDQSIWVANDETEDSVSWRAAVIRPIQMVCVMGAALLPLVLALVAVGWLSK